MKNRIVPLFKIFGYYNADAYTHAIINSLSTFNHIDVKSRIWKVDDPAYRVKAINTFLTDLIKDNKFNREQFIQLKKRIVYDMISYISIVLFTSHFEYTDFRDYDCIVYNKTYSFNDMLQFWYNISGLNNRISLNDYLLNSTIKYTNEVFYTMSQCNFFENDKKKVPLYYGIFESNITDMINFNRKISSQFIGISVEDIYKFLVQNIHYIIYRNRDDINKSIIVYNKTDETPYFRIYYDLNRSVSYMRSLDYKITKEMLLNNVNKETNEDLELEIQFYNNDLNLPYIFKLFESKARDFCPCC